MKDDDEMNVVSAAMWLGVIILFLGLLGLGGC